MPRTTLHEKPKDIRKTLKFLRRYLRKHSAVLLLVSVMVAVSAGANVYGTYLLKPTVNDYILPGNMSGLVRMLLFMGAVYLIGCQDLKCRQRKSCCFAHTGDQLQSGCPLWASYLP